VHHDTPANTSSPVPLATAAVLGPSAEADFEYVRERHLQLPVAGIRADQLADSFDEPRDGARRHRAIDILAPRGTPVLAADDGRVLRVSWNSAGGNTVYTTDTDGRVVYYYAHLDHYHESLAAGMTLTKGDTIGFVGTTGNAPKDIPHLHFQIMRMPRDGKYWNGEPINPFSVLRGEGERP
jgi:murein DD-endopeptidase MepM/ murein hydrolase activator NlpD